MMVELELEPPPNPPKPLKPKKAGAAGAITACCGAAAKTGAAACEGVMLTIVLEGCAAGMFGQTTV